MANEVKKVTVEIDVDTKGVKQGGAAIESTFEKVNNSVNKTKQSAKDAGDTAVSSFDRMGAALKRVGAIVAAGAIINGLKNLVTKSVELSAKFEQTRVSFETFLKSADKAKKLLAELNKFSLATPFTPDQVNESAKALLAFGIAEKKILPNLKQIGDISAATGKDFNELAVIFGKARTQGTLFAEDINQLTEAGIPVIDEFAKQLGVSTGEVKKLGSQGKISFKNLEQAFSDLTGEGGKFFGLMEAQSQTLAGRFSTLEGSTDELLRAFGDRLAPIVGDIVEGFIDMADSARKFIEVPVSDKLEEERIGLNVLVQQITETNIKEEDRLKLINQLNAEYPDFLENIKAEEISNQQLTIRLKEVNEQLINRIVIQRKQEEIDEQAERAAEARINKLETEEEIRKKLVDAVEDHNITLLEEGTLLERAIDARKQLSVLAKESGLGFAFNTAQQSAFGLTRSLRELEEQQRAVNTRTKDLNNLTKEREALMVSLNVSIDEETEATEEGNKEIVKRLGLLDAINKKISDLKKQLGEQNTIEGIGNILEQVEKLEKEREAIITIATNKIEDITITSNEKLQQVEAEAIDIRKENLAKEIENSDKRFDALVDRQNREIALAREKNAILIGLGGELAQGLLTIGDKRLDEERRQIEERFNTEIAAAEDNKEVRTQLEQEKNAKLEELAERQKTFEFAQFALSKVLAVSEVILNLQKEIALIGSNPFLSTLPDAGLAAKTGLIAGAKARAAGSIATIAIQSLVEGAFAEGTDYVHGPGTTTSDSILARLSKGEAVVQADMNQKYSPVVQAIRRDNLDQYLSKEYIPKNLSDKTDSHLLTALLSKKEFDDSRLLKINKRALNTSVQNTSSIVKAIVRSNRNNRYR